MFSTSRILYGRQGLGPSSEWAKLIKIAPESCNRSEGMCDSHRRTSFYMKYPLPEQAEFETWGCASFLRPCPPQYLRLPEEKGQIPQEQQNGLQAYTIERCWHDRQHSLGICGRSSYHRPTFCPRWPYAAICIGGGESAARTHDEPSALYYTTARRRVQRRATRPSRQRS